MLLKYLAYLKVLMKYLEADRVKKTQEKYNWLMEQWFIRKVNLLFIRRLLSCWQCYNPWLKEKIDFLKRYNSSFNTLIILLKDLFIPSEYSEKNQSRKETPNKPIMYFFFFSDQLRGDYFCYLTLSYLKVSHRTYASGQNSSIFASAPQWCNTAPEMMWQACGPGHSSRKQVFGNSINFLTQAAVLASSMLGPGAFI